MGNFEHNFTRPSQMSTEDQCVDDKLESAIENSDCDASLVEPLIVSLSDDYEDEDEQELLTGFRIFCTPTNPGGSRRMQLLR